jgi:hypothetical protein
VRAWAFAGFTVTIMGVAKAPVPVIAALRKTSLRSTRLRTSPAVVPPTGPRSGGNVSDPGSSAVAPTGYGARRWLPGPSRVT